MRGRTARFTAALQALLLMATLVLPALAAATEISTDLWIYQDGDTVTVTGIDFGANEVVDFTSTDPEGTVVDAGSATSDENGGVVYAFVLNVTVGGIYDVVAIGQSSGLSAATQFDPPVNISTTTTLSVVPASLGYGSSTTLSGTLNWTNPTLNNGNQTRAGRTIHLRRYTSTNCTGGNSLQDVTTTAPNATSAGSYTFTYSPAAVTGSVQASFDAFQTGSGGSADNYQASSSSCTTLTVTKAASTTTGSTSSSAIFDTQSFTVGYSVSASDGVVGNLATGTLVVAKVSGPGGAGSLGCSGSVAVSQAQTPSWNQANPTGFTCTPSGGPGTYQLRLDFTDTDGNYSNSSSSTLTVIVSAAHATSLSESLAPSSIIYGEQTTAFGTLTDTTDSTPIQSVSVVESERNTQNTSCGGSEIAALGNDITDSSGAYSLAFTPNAAGTFDIRARYAGDASHSAAQGCATLAVDKAPTVTTLTLGDTSITTVESTTADGSILSHYGISGNNAVGSLGFELFSATDCTSGSLGLIGTAEAVNVAQANADNNPVSEVGFSFASAGTHSISGLAAGTYGVRVLFSDNNGLDGNYSNSSDCETLTVTSGNEPPTVDAGGPYSGNEGSSIALDGGSANDPDGDALTYLWTLDSYNSNIDASGSCSIADPTSLTLATISCDDDSNAGSFTVRLTVSGDPAGDVSDTAEVTVANVAPTVTLGASNDLSADESNVTEYSFTYTRSDAGSNDVLTSTPSCGANGSLVALSDNGSSFKCKFLDGGPTPPGTDSTVSIYVTDDESAASTTAEQTVNISNVNPVVAQPSFSVTTVCQGASATLSGLSFSDAGVDDDPWALSTDWGDGSTDTSASASTQGAQSNQLHTYNLPGVWTATLTVTDKDGGVGSNTSSNTVTVVAHYSIYFLQPVDGTTTGTTSNAVKLGRVVPVKILVWDNCANDFAGGWVTDPATLVRLRASEGNVSNGALLDTVEAYADAGQANSNTLYFRWTADASAPGGGFWIYNLDTKNSNQPKFELNKTYRIEATIGGVLPAGSGSQYALLKMVK